MLCQRLLSRKFAKLQQAELHTCYVIDNRAEQFVDIYHEHLFFLEWSHAINIMTNPNYLLIARGMLYSETELCVLSDSETHMTVLLDRKTLEAVVAFIIRTVKSLLWEALNPNTYKIFALSCGCLWRIPWCQMSSREQRCIGDAPTTSEWSTMLLPTKMRLILEILRYTICMHKIELVVWCHKTWPTLISI